jgi:hypothetical protein
MSGAMESALAEILDTFDALKAFTMVTRYTEPTPEQEATLRQIAAQPLPQFECPNVAFALSCGSVTTSNVRRSLLEFVGFIEGLNAEMQTLELRTHDERAEYLRGKQHYFSQGSSSVELLIRLGRYARVSDRSRHRYHRKVMLGESPYMTLPGEPGHPSLTPPVATA